VRWHLEVVGDGEAFGEEVVGVGGGGCSNFQARFEL
jgi:hypothetical protein